MELLSAPRTWTHRLVAALLTMSLVLVGLTTPVAAQEAQPTTPTTGTTAVAERSTATTSPSATTEPTLEVEEAPNAAPTEPTASPEDGRIAIEPVLVEAPTTTTLPVTDAVPVAEPEPKQKTVEPAVTTTTIDSEPILTPEDIEITSASKEAGWVDATLLDDFDAGEYTGSMWWVTQEITGAADYWSAGYTGDGVDVAIIDTGVSPVKGLNGKNQLVYGPDLSFESQSEEFAFVDTFGHGTHLAGIIAGRDGDPTRIARNDNRFLGMAPDSRLVSVKVGTHNGAVDISQVIAAVDWVIEHRTDNGLNIRVLNLSYGTDSKQSWRTDPLSYAVERAWDAGIVVVVSAGNDGNASGLRNPATNPHVIAVGASESNMTFDAADDHLAEFSSCGRRWRAVDVVAPGRSIVSLRSPGSSADVNHPEAQVEKRYFLGSGTSQAAAVVSGAAALIIDQRPDISPDEVKALLKRTAQRIPNVTTYCQGAGLIDLSTALDTSTPWGRKVRRSADGSGSLEASRGSAHIELEGVVLEGEQDIFGQPWDSAAWVAAGESDGTWNGGTWNETAWTADTWSSSSWSSSSWGGLSWGGLSWGGLSWGGLSWGGLSWGGLSWGGLSWGGLSWGGLSWS